MPVERKHKQSEATANFDYWLNDAINQDEYEEMIFFYHKDHLGSSTQISDNDANIIQHIEYMPYGETFFERRDYWNTPYKFNAKELDAETGLYYYGARYYTPEVSIWLSVDPLADKYPSMSAYMYCAGNPVIIVDPDGRDWYKDTEGEIVYNSNIHNKQSMVDMGIDGEYLGKTYKNEGKYYGLFGQVKSLKTTEGKLHEKIDKALINYANYSKEYSNYLENMNGEEPYEKSTDFRIDLPFNMNKLGFSDDNDYTFSYDDAVGYLN